MATVNHQTENQYTSSKLQENQLQAPRSVPIVFCQRPFVSVKKNSIDIFSMFFYDHKMNFIFLTFSFTINTLYITLKKNIFTLIFWLTINFCLK